MEAKLFSQAIAKFLGGLLIVGLLLALCVCGIGQSVTHWMKEKGRKMNLLNMTDPGGKTAGERCLPKRGKTEQVRCRMMKRIALVRLNMPDGISAEVG